jgi:hypothetical protein
MHVWVSKVWTSSMTNAASRGKAFCRGVLGLSFAPVSLSRRTLEQEVLKFLKRCRRNRHI